MTGLRAATITSLLAILLLACTTHPPLTAPTPTPTSTPTPTPSPSGTPTSTPTSTPTATPTATYTATPTPTPSPTPTPTSSPTPTPTSSPTPTPPPPTLTIELDPPQVEQGHTLLVRVHSSAPVTLTGTLDDQEFVFVEDGEGYWALVGFPAWSPAGPHHLNLMAADGMGRMIYEEATVEVVAIDFPVEAITLPPDRTRLLTPELVQAERERLAPIFQSVTQEQLWDGVFVTPVEGEITSPFGARRSYNGGPPRSYHEGVDFRGKEGTPVVAANTGRVALAEALTVRGKALILDHGLGVHTGYYHLSEILVQEGQRVAEGDLIGRVGGTGLATGPHLHWELRVRGVNVDPLEWTQQPMAP